MFIAKGKYRTFVRVICPKYLNFELLTNQKKGQPLQFSQYTAILLAHLKAAIQRISGINVQHS